MITDHASLLNKLYCSALLDGGLTGVLSDLARAYPDLPISYQAQCVYQNTLYDCAFFNHLGEDPASQLARTESANPFPPLALKCAMSDVGVTSDFIAPEDVEKLDFYDEFLKPQGEINRAMGIILHRQGDDSAFVAANLPKTMGRREEDHVLNLFRYLRPHLQGAFSLLLEVARRQVRLTYPDFWLDQIPAAACILEPDGRILHLNARADSLFRRADNLFIDRTVRLTARDSHTRTVLQTVLSGARASALPAGPVLLTRGKTANPFLFAIPIQHKDEVHPGLAPFIAPSMPLLVTIFDPEEAPGRSETLLAAALGLSQRESELIQQLILGSSLKEAAERIGISYHTARNHLASATSKTGSRSQSDIIRRGTQILSRVGDGNGRTG
ncbi:helix-turn-helix transcriptional regulator [Roseibium sp.]|uniref:helix-turn-helix transcriptional regulator n=1 Tax=Roseibium sp. TaxID=1936156 RepID=UPI003D0E0934